MGHCFAKTPVTLSSPSGGNIKRYNQSEKLLAQVVHAVGVCGRACPKRGCLTFWLSTKVRIGASEAARRLHPCCELLMAERHTKTLPRR